MVQKDSLGRKHRSNLAILRLDPTKTPLVLIACGSFSPITFLHMRMFEMARDHAKLHTQYEVVGAYLSPVSDQYKKAGLAPALHRYHMCRLACLKASDWLMVDPWEIVQPTYSKTADVLDHFEHELNEIRGGVTVIQAPGTASTSSVPLKRKVKIMLLAGSDLILTMSEPKVWDPQDVRTCIAV